MLCTMHLIITTRKAVPDFCLFFHLFVSFPDCDQKQRNNDSILKLYTGN